MSLTTTRTAIQTAIATINGLRCYGTIPGAPQLDCAVIGWPDEFNPHTGFGDIVDYIIPVWLMVGFQSNRSADTRLMKYLDTTGAMSVIAAIETGHAGWNVPSVHDFGPITIGDSGQLALACILDVHVMS